MSKQYLAGDWDLDRLGLYKPEKFADLDLELHLGDAAISLDPDARQVTLNSGSTVSGDAIVIATGARARTLPGTENLDRVFVLRNLNHARSIRQVLADSPARIAVVGAGFIGAEVAATVRGRGVDCTMIDAAVAPMVRGLGIEVGTLAAELHRSHGVDLRLEVGVDSIESTAGACQVHLTDGESVVADGVVVGIGAVPNTEWLTGSGLAIDDGVICDATCKAADGVWAVGDVARWPSTRFGEMVRVEHWENAVDQASYVAGQILAVEGADADLEPDPYDPVPWFWSDQYDRKIQMAGRVGPDDQVQVIDGSHAEQRFAQLHGRNGALVGVMGFNRPRQIMKWRQAIAEGISFAEACRSATEAPPASAQP